MFSVYVLKSLRNGKRYVGSTSKEPELRLKEHNSGSNSWTRQNGPFKILKTEVYKYRFEAIKRERFLKSGAGRAQLDNELGD